MIDHRKWWTVPSALALVVCLAASILTSAAEKSTSRRLAVGVPETFFRNLPPNIAKTLTGPLKQLLEIQTGVSTDLVMGEDHEALARQLKEDQAQVAVMHGFEYAWLRDKYPELKPLLVAVDEGRQLRAYLVTQADRKAKDMNDLAKTSLVLPPLTKQHCRLFLERHCRDVGKTPEELFSETKTAEELGLALDAVAYGKEGATVIDQEALNWYKERRPSRFAKLKVVAESELFPATVVVYREGAVPEAMLKKLHDGLMAAGRSADGKALLTVCRIASFEEVPRDYEQQLVAIRKAYPPPDKSE